MGGYRPSSLRLIDAAVAAAQAVEPGFGDDADNSSMQWWANNAQHSEPAQDGVQESQSAADADFAKGSLGRIALVKVPRTKVTAIGQDLLRQAVESAEMDHPGESGDSTELLAFDDIQSSDEAHSASVPAVVAPESERSDAIPSELNDHRNDITAPLTHASHTSRPVAPYFAEPISQNSTTETSAMRMISSLGRESAQVAGEVTGPIATNSPSAKEEEVAREIVTIKPRRITREIPIEALADKVSAAATAAAKVATATAVVAAASSKGKPVNPAVPVIPSSVGTATAAAAIPNRPKRPSAHIPVSGGTARKSSSNTVLLVSLLSIAAIATLLYTKCRPHSSRESITIAPLTPVPQTKAVVPPDALSVGSSTPEPIIPTPPIPTPPVPTPTPAPVEVKDTKTTKSGDKKVYRESLNKARNALGEGDALGALNYATESIIDKPTASAYVVKADALRRLGKNKEALMAADNAVRMGSNFAPAWEMKGRVLWGMKDTAAATVAFRKFLQLEPKSSRADGVRELIGE
jgi:Tetratricopeptide repeat